MNAIRKVVITDTIEGFHCWPQARDMFPEVGFLSDRHRHQFKIRIEAKVTHSDRDIEFIMFKRNWKEVIESFKSERHSDANWYEFGRMSCEDIAHLILAYWQKVGVCKVEVWEDGENGAIVELEE